MTTTPGGRRTAPRLTNIHDLLRSRAREALGRDAEPSAAVLDARSVKNVRDGCGAGRPRPAPNGLAAASPRCGPSAATGLGWPEGVDILKLDVESRGRGVPVWASIEVHARVPVCGPPPASRPPWYSMRWAVQSAGTGAAGSRPGVCSVQSPKVMRKMRSLLLLGMLSFSPKLLVVSQRPPSTEGSTVRSRA